MLDDKIILITGVGGGIGEVILENLAPKVKHIISASRTPIKGVPLKSKILNWTHYALDLTLESNVITLFDSIQKTFGRLDCVINTIGGSLYSFPLENFPLEKFDEVIRVNLTSAFLLTKAAIKIMKANTPPGGHIVHFVSSSTKKISHQKGPYGIAKAGLARLIQYSAAEVAASNIKVNGISPTYVFTPRHEAEITAKAEKIGQSREIVVKKILADQLLAKPLYPADMLPLVELLITTQIITGQIYDATLGEILSF